MKTKPLRRTSSASSPNFGEPMEPSPALEKSLIIIPSRLGSTRLKDKALADICGKTMIERVLFGAQKSGITTIVATDDSKIKNVVQQAGGIAIMTDVSHQSGTDRIFEALNKFDLEGKYEYIINVQGDVPNIDSNLILEVLNILIINDKADISTAVLEVSDFEKAQKTSVVKAVLSHKMEALYFSRLPVPFGAKTFFEHIGIYGYRRKSLEKFVKIGVSKLEAIEKLEQLRALENNMKIFATKTSFQALSIDVQEDLDLARKHFQNTK